MQKSKKSPVSYVSILLYDDSGNFLLFYSRSADSPSPGLSKILSAAYNFGTCFLELPAIVLWVMYIESLLIARGVITLVSG